MNPIKSFTIEFAGYSVHADWYQGSTTQQILLSLIGWSSNKKRYDDIIHEIVNKTGMSALVFDYSGHGINTEIALEETSPALHFMEAVTVYDWIRQNYPESQITVMGSSYGGYLAARLIQYRDVEALLLRVPAIYPEEDFYTKYKDRDHAALAAYRLSSAKLASNPVLHKAKQFKGRVQIMVHEKDIDVPRPTTDAYIEAFGASSYLAKGFPHGLMDVPKVSQKKYLTTMIKWLTTT